jgi:hypothetical protein
MYDVLAQLFVYLFAVAYIVFFLWLFQRWALGLLRGKKKTHHRAPRNTSTPSPL